MNINNSKIQFLEESLSRNLEWIKSSEARLPVVLSLDTAMLAVFAALVPESIFCESIFLNVIFWSTTLLLLLSILFSSFSAFPRTKGPKMSLIYFFGILERSFDEYKKDIHNLNEEEYIEDLMSQCYRNAEIAKQKYLWIKNSMICLYLAAIPWLITISFLINS
ncbi:MAG: Pycsar system effector family protein [Candidatus Paceibacterota bacterium]